MASMDVTATCVKAAPRKRWSQKTAVIASVVVLLTSTVAALVASEVVVRIVAPQQLIVAPTGIYRPDPKFGWRHKEGLNVVVNTGEGAVLFRTDENGYRITSSQSATAYDPQKVLKRVVTIGDSFLEAAAVEAEATIPALMQSRLSSRLGGAVVVDSDSAAGWDPNQYLLAAKRAAERSQYDAAVVFLYIGNDVTGSKVERYAAEHVAQRHPFRIPVKLSRKELIDAFLYPVNDVLETNSHLFVFAKKRLDMILARLGLTAMYFPRIFLRGERGSESWRVTTEICETIEAEFRQNGTYTVFVLIPAPYQVDEASFQRYVEVFNLDVATVDLKQPNHILADYFAEKSLKLLDPLPQLRSKHNAGIQLYGEVDRHFNKKGHLAITEIVLPVVEAILQSESCC